MMIRTGARLLLAALFLAAGILHLALPMPFLRIVPGWVPWPLETVIATGVCEIAGAAGLVTRRWRRAAGIGLALYSACVFPANVKHAIDDLGAGTGLPLWYHAPRLLLQPAIILWCLWAGEAILGSTPRRSPEPTDE